MSPPKKCAKVEPPATASQCEKLIKEYRERMTHLCIPRLQLHTHGHVLDWAWYGMVWYGVTYVGDIGRSPYQGLVSSRQ